MSWPTLPKRSGRGNPIQSFSGLDSPLAGHSPVRSRLFHIVFRIVSEEMPSLFDPFTVKSITLRNRIGVSPMCQYSSTDGRMDDWHLVHLGARASGGAALVVAEASAVSPDGRITAGDAGIWSDDQVEPLARIGRFVRSQGAVLGIQIAHAGRKASDAIPWKGGGQIPDGEPGGWPTLSASPIAFGSSLPKVPRAMSLGDIATVQGQFVQAAIRALTAGCEWLELHAAHGYLIHQFLSPLSNHRSDAYGGSFDNRIRFLLETTRAVRQVWPDRLPLTVRLSCTDWVDGGWDIDQCVEVSRRLKAEGVDLVDCSSGGLVPGAKIPVGPGYQVPFAERIRREAAIGTIAVGMITEPAQADAIIRSEQADVVFLARAFLRDPDWALNAARQLRCLNRLSPPIQYARAF